MTTADKNKYSKGTHISERKFRHLIKCFSLDLNAYETSQITKKRKISKSTERNIRANLPRKYQKINRRLLRLVWILYSKKRFLVSLV